MENMLKVKFQAIIIKKPQLEYAYFLVDEYMLYTSDLSRKDLKAQCTSDAVKPNLQSKNNGVHGDASIEHWDVYTYGVMFCEVTAGIVFGKLGFTFLHAQCE